VTQRLLLVRHGVTEWNRQGRFQGHLDPPLDAGGRTEVALLAGRLATEPGLRPERVITSPLLRAAESAEILADALRGAGGGPLVEHDARLMEIGQGEWEGRTHAELARDDADRYATWRSHAGDRQPPGAESIEDALTRVAAALDEVTSQGPWPLCIVSHGGTLRLAARHLLGVEGRRAWSLDLDNASLSVLERMDPTTSWRLVHWNDTRHLLGRADLHVDESEGEPLAL